MTILPALPRPPLVTAMPWPRCCFVGKTATERRASGVSLAIKQFDVLRVVGPNEDMGYWRALGFEIKADHRLQKAGGRVGFRHKVRHRTALQIEVIGGRPELG